MYVARLAGLVVFDPNGDQVGRVRDLGGTATVHTAPGQGTEWEIAVPRGRTPLRADS